MMHWNFLSTDKLRFALLAAILLLWMNADAAKRALLIGLGEQQDASWGKVHGDRDIPIINGILTECGYTDITTLTNRKATKKGITDAFQTLKERCRKGDTVYVHFSGHGQRVTDLDGDEEDGWDEAWIPYDAYKSYSSRYKGEKHLTDDEVGVYIQRIKDKIGSSGKLLVVVDACHSGESSRGDSLINESDSEILPSRGSLSNFVIPLSAKPKRKKQASENWLTLSACKSYQTNYEMSPRKGEFYGMLSYCLATLGDERGRTDNSCLLQHIKKQYRHWNKRSTQDPFLSGTAKYRISDFFKK